MSFALPIALSLAALALPIIALYILKVRLRRVPVSTNLFWKQIYEEKPPRSLWNRFRHLTSLLLQLLLLLLIVLAIADPVFDEQLLQARRLVIVVDNSASMQATDIKPTRLDAAKAAATKIVEGLRFQDEAAIVLAGKSPEVVAGMTSHIPTLQNAIHAISSSDNPTSLNAAIDLGQRLVGQHPHGQVLVMTDGCVTATGLHESLKVREAHEVNQPADTNSVSLSNVNNPQKVRHPAVVETQIFGTKASNTGITQFQVRRNPVDPAGYEIFVALKNASANAVTCRLELTLDDIPIDVIPLTLKADELWSRSLEKASLEGGILKATLTQFAGAPSQADGYDGSQKKETENNDKDVSDEVDFLSVDNTAWAILPSRKTQRILIVSEGNLFLQKAFEANPLVEITMKKQLPNDWPADSIIVLHGKVPAKLPDGHVFVIDPAGDCDQWDEGQIIDNPIVANQDKISSLMSHIRLDNVIVPEAKQLLFRTPSRPLATTLKGEVVYAEINRPNGKCLVLSVNLDSSDLAFRTTFPILVANALGWFSGSSGEFQASLATGSITTLLVSPKSSPAQPVISGLTNPEQNFAAETDSEQPLAAILHSPQANPERISILKSENEDSGRALIGPLSEVGIWSLASNDALPSAGDYESADSVFAQCAVNLASEPETDLRPLLKTDMSPETTILNTGWFAKPFWFYLIVVASLLTTVEWLLYQRRVVQ